MALAQPGVGAVKALHRRGDGANVVINHHDDVISDVIKLNATEENAVKAIRQNPHLSAAKLAEILGIKQRQTQRIIASLKQKAGLQRQGARKNGEWHFTEPLK